MSQEGKKRFLRSVGIPQFLVAFSLYMLLALLIGHAAGLSVGRTISQTIHLVIVWTIVTPFVFAWLGRLHDQWIDRMLGK